MQFFGVNVDLQTNSDHPVNNYTVTGGFAFFPVDSFPQQIQDEEFNGGVVMLYEEGRAMSQETYTTPGGLTATIVEVAPAPGAVLPTTDYNAHFSINGIQYLVAAQPYCVGMTGAEVAASDDPAHTLDVLKTVLDGFVLN